MAEYTSLTSDPTIQDIKNFIKQINILDADYNESEETLTFYSLITKTT